MKKTTQQSRKLIKTVACELDYCIYNKDNECILKKISISAEGSCNDCIMPTINKKTLEKYKQATRKTVEKVR